MTPPSIQAVTLYGRPIAKAFSNLDEAITWAEENKSVFPGCKIISQADSKPKTVWEDQQ